jgi:hypothetical protein
MFALDPPPPDPEGFSGLSATTRLGVFRFRLYRFENDLLLAATDAELIGRSVSRGDVEVHITEQFYGEKEADQGELRELLGRCTVANLMGERCVALAAGLGFVDDANVVEIEDVPHAQVARMKR